MNENFVKKWMNIQSELNAPKNQYNGFGKYSYRSAEDILEALKPLLKKNGMALLLTDELVYEGDRYYIRATAMLTDGTDSVSNSALAREEKEKKGMDSAQVTGSTSSFARKYALNGLFCIDDNKDRDSEEFQTEVKERAKSTGKKTTSANVESSGAKVGPAEVNDIRKLAEAKGKTALSICNYYKVKALEELTMNQYEEIRALLAKEKK